MTVFFTTFALTSTLSRWYLLSMAAGVEVCYFDLCTHSLTLSSPTHGMRNEPAFHIPLALCFNSLPCPSPQVGCRLATHCPRLDDSHSLTSFPRTLSILLPRASRFSCDIAASATSSPASATSSSVPFAQSFLLRAIASFAE
jgi:hypothetical protein